MDRKGAGNDFNLDRHLSMISKSWSWNQPPERNHAYT